MYLKDKGKYERGKKYAECQVEKFGEGCIDRLESEADGAIDYDDFDRGIRSFLFDYAQRSRTPEPIE